MTRSRLSLTNLEAREVPAVSVFETSAAIHVIADGDAVGENVTITRPNIWNPITIRDNTTGVVRTFPQGQFEYKPVIFVGGNGGDVVSAANALTPVRLNGNGGDDSLTGGLLRDYLDGGAGNDTLRGGASSDTMYGRGGMDQLFGDAGSDFLDAGSAWFESVEGGSGDDFLAHKPVVGGTTASDVNQTGTPTCWVLAPIAAAAKSGINLAERITYLGDGEYNVILKLPASGIVMDVPFKVNLEGGRYDFEPSSRGQDESWVVLFHRAIMQAEGVDWKDKDDYSSGFPQDIMHYLTGRVAQRHGSWGADGGNYNKTNDHEMALINLHLSADKLVVATTRQGDFDCWHIMGSVNTPKLVGRHCYSIESVNMASRTVVVRNPWGFDVNMDPQNGPVGTPSGTNSDGLITLSFHQFYESMWDYSVS